MSTNHKTSIIICCHLNIHIQLQFMGVVCFVAMYQNFIKCISHTLWLILLELNCPPLKIPFRLQTSIVACLLLWQRRLKGLVAQPVISSNPIDMAIICQGRQLPFYISISVLFSIEDTFGRSYKTDVVDNLQQGALKKNEAHQIDMKHHCLWCIIMIKYSSTEIVSILRKPILCCGYLQFTLQIIKSIIITARAYQVLI